eukprot:7551041-Lingulodinium_polyedra.AAC.1
MQRRAGCAEGPGSQQPRARGCAGEQVPQGRHGFLHGGIGGRREQVGREGAILRRRRPMFCAQLAAISSQDGGHYW